jgi:hypothetical protein
MKMLADWLELKTHGSELKTAALQVNTARELLDVSGKDPALSPGLRESAGICRTDGTGVEVKVLLAGYNGDVLYFR